ncbi:hypothetical protein HKBW3S03_00469 [Candidatus Hakubella thermalkaliphila]|uniref:Uncharacterized protein n=1 Tax=Candidatus Hakubella thermalkaliphila TaxID=2754717 RepID=A0A6V8NFE3_9ACTN|nr:hypothetical protein HKBW3S03_00469 [Candidatus Hakubella thermalkaliphila]GFP29467.1 hypothetical protein HKBW3S34_00387 [Candidatus Hakubella thermalkaliphila]GFP41128.1 hypothetical protein HKBW3C_00254 [Candidatus Hakubella thermalkaliphila]
MIHYSGSMPPLREVILKQRRYDELIQLAKEDIEAELREVRSAKRLLRSLYHLKKHGRKVGATTGKEYWKSIRRLQGDDKARIFTYRDPKYGNSVNWALISVERGHVLLYNKEDGIIATFFAHHPDDLPQYLRSRQSLWVEIKTGPEEGYLIKEDWSP